ncbi:MAG: hypothetical protein ACRD1P_02255 [Thermoanaerobaculia bacterium]
MNFFRQAALLLPCAFLLGVLLFLLTHGREDPAFGTYPFFEAWKGSAQATATPEASFLEQAFVFFAPAYAVTLLFILSVSAAETAVFGSRQTVPRSDYTLVFGAVFNILFLIATGVLVLVGDRTAGRLMPGTLVAPVLAAAAPFGAAVLAVLPAAILAAPLCALRRRYSA